MTSNRMVAAWEKSLLVKIEPIGDTNAVRVIPLTDTLWQANTDHYKYAPAEVQETVTKCDTISVSDTSETDTVVTKCDTPSQNVTGTVTKCDDIEHEIDRNIDKNISNKNIDTISSTNVEDALPPYKDGLRPKSILKGWLADITLLDDAFLAEMEKMLPSADLSTPLPQTVDTMSHSHVVQATGNEGEDNGTDTQHSRDNSAGHLRIGPLLPISGGSGLHHDSHPEGYLESAQRRGRVESATRKKASKPKAEPAAPPAIQLTEQQQAFWLLWCDIWFNQDIPPELNETAYKHVKKLSPLVKTKEQLEDLVKHARVEMEASGFKRKVVHLGNLVNSYPGWKQQSRPIAPGVAVPQNFTGMGRLLHIKPQEANRGQTFTS